MNPLLESVPDCSRTMINITNKLSDTQKKSLKEEIMDEITKKVIKKLMEKLQAQLIRKYKMHSRNIKTPQIKNLRRHRNN
jgi:hypothetical protein